MRKGLWSEYCLVFIVICFLVIVLSSVDWVFGEVWLILLISKILVKIGLWWKWKLLFWGWKMENFNMLEGSRFGVYWMCWNLRLMDVVSDLVRVVFLIFGMFLIKIEFVVIRVMIIWLMIFCLFWIIEFKFCFSCWIFFVKFFLVMMGFIIVI